MPASITSDGPTTEQPSSSDKTCPHCGRGFKKASHLIRHKRSHEHEKPFECTSCGKVFARNDALQRHERTVHATKRQRTSERAASDASPGEDSAQSVNDRLVLGSPSYSNNEPPQGDLWTLPIFNVSHSTEVVSTSSRPALPSGPEQTIHRGYIENTIFPLNHLPSGADNSNLQWSDQPTFDATDPYMSSFDLNALLNDWLSSEAGPAAPDTDDLTHLLFEPPPTEYLRDPIFGSIPVASTPRDDSRSGLAIQTSDISFDFGQQPDLCSPQDRRLGIQSNAGGAVANGVGTTTESRADEFKSAVGDSMPLTADTWESGISPPIDESVPAITTTRRPMRSRITSPKQVVEELEISEHETPTIRQVDRAIPSMKFLDSCLHLYFRNFHPSFPIIHRPTFQRDRTSPLLLLSMCSIGCMYVGTQNARESGLRIYERLHYVIVYTRDSKMASETTRVAVTISALLGQCFSFLYGRPKQMLTAEFFHGTVCTMARRSGLLQLVKQGNLISADQVNDLGPDDLNRIWRNWSRREMLRRVSLGLTIHAAECTAYSNLPRLIPAHVSEAEDFRDDLFEALSAHDWRQLIIGSTYRPNASIESFFPTILLAQKMVRTRILRELSVVASTRQINDSPSSKLEFYNEMDVFGRRFGLIESHDSGSFGHTTSRASSRRAHLLVLWHWACAIRLAPIDDVEEAAGRGGLPSADSIRSLRTWSRTPAARLAMLHSAHVLDLAEGLRESAFLIPRAIFHATLLLLCYLSLSLPDYGATPVDCLEAINWLDLATIAFNNTEVVIEGARQEYVDAVGSESTNLERFLLQGRGYLEVKGFVEGQDPMMGIVGLVRLPSSITRNWVWLKSTDYNRRAVDY